MAVQVIRYQSSGSQASHEPQWGVVFGDKVAPLAGSFSTTGEFVKHGLQAAKAATAGDATLALSGLALMSPVTSNQQLVCQGINYPSHIRESGLDPDNLPFNSIFTKASSCISGPFDDVVRPRHVKLLDYEIELGLVLKTDLLGEVSVRADKLHEYLAGITIVNDVSARDVQLPQGQFYKGKSYRTFGPVGPYLLLLEPAEWQQLSALRMTLEVNGEVRQQDVCGSMVNKPHTTLTELSGLQNLYAGDLIATGTPAGCAAQSPGRLAMLAAKVLLSDAQKWRIFIKGGLKNPKYLQPNDVMTLSIRTVDGVLDLGTQRTKIVAQA
ncbi:MAG: fumarylacetoacetate hydrolase family protein [Aquabacterium sp.]|uniref:fumarylacetoacetate hydrolase family protein n=1 Tax=Aquabacterium sp. TaxID=1872578 RepID=UPI002728B9D6|nr:fumarylacetoacetate hydrolase family protein [Aquabacterium sp.]MDO9002891.1 fumarylacetoacetate hydrolase family protein [Aquabacterium sp.]